MLGNRWLRCLCVLLSFSLIGFISPKWLYAEYETVDCFSVTDGLEFNVDASIVSAWDTYANLEFTITNTGTDTIHNWYFTADLGSAIVGIWGAIEYDRDNTGMYTLKNAGWNQDILPGSTISFGMTVSSLNGQAISKLPSFYLLNTKVCEVDQSNYSLSYHEYSSWGTGYNGALVLSNISSDPIEDWSISFSANRSINTVSGAELSVSEETITIANDGTNQNIEPTSTLTLTVVGGLQNNDVGFETSDILMHSVSCAFGLADDADNSGKADFMDFIHDAKESQIISPTPSTTPVETPKPSVTVTSTPVPTPDIQIDSDEDGIPDYYEQMIGSDIYSKDSDNDGIEDAIEIILGLDPLSQDSDDDGISDSQEDNDNDGLTILQEIYYGTYTWTNDSDVDGVSDGDEISVYQSNPVNPDSDGDGIEDGDEVKLNLDPTNSDSDGDGIPDGQERFFQTRKEEISNSEHPAVNRVEVSVEGTGCLDSAMIIEDVYDTDAYSREIVGLIGSPVNIEYDGDFEQALISFHYDENRLSSTKPNIPDALPIEDNYVTTPQSLGIFYFDEDTGLYVDCDATVDTINHTVSCATTHFSTYMVMDKAIWYYWWSSLKYSGEMRPSHEGYKGIDYVLEIPYVDSMTESDIREMNAIATRIIDNMQDGDRMVIRGYNTGGIYTYDYSDDKDLLKSQVINWPWHEGETWVGYNYGPMDLIGTELSGLEIFNIAYSTNNHNPDNELIVIAFHNSADIECQFYSTYHRTRQEMTAYIFTLSSGNSNTPSLKWLNHVAGGGVIDCGGKTADEVYEEYVNLYGLRQGLDLDPRDDGKFGDGLWDIYEKQGFLSTNGCFYYSDPTQIDTDKDDLSDYSEIGSCTIVDVTDSGEIYINDLLVYRDEDDSSDIQGKQLQNFKMILSYGAGKWTIYKVHSDPYSSDTDCDDAVDNFDANPLKKNPFASYCFYGENPTDEQLAMFWTRYEEKVFKCNCFIEKITTSDSFKKAWNNMGKNSLTNNTSPLIFYRIQNVHMNCHGLLGELSMGSCYVLSNVRLEKALDCYLKRFPDTLQGMTRMDQIKTFKEYVGYLTPDDLTPQSICVLYLDVCYGGETNHLSRDYKDYSFEQPTRIDYIRNGIPDYKYGFIDSQGEMIGAGTNMAVAFLFSKNNIAIVRAWDGVYGTRFTDKRTLFETLYDTVTIREGNCTLYQCVVDRVTGKEKQEYNIYYREDDEAHYYTVSQDSLDITI